MDKVFFPFYQVKVAGQVVDHTNDHAKAHDQARKANARPAEIWLIPSTGVPKLIHKSA